MKFNSDKLYSLQYKAQRLHEMAVVTAYANEEDQDYWFSVVIGYAEEIKKELDQYKEGLSSGQDQ